MGPWIFILWVIIQYYFILLLKFFQVGTLGSLSVGSCFTFMCPDCVFCFWKYFLNSWHYKILLAYLVYFLLGTSSIFSIPVLECPFPPFSKKTWFFFLDNSVRNQDLGIRFVHCYWDVTDSRPSRLMDQGNICVYPVSIHVSVYISACDHFDLY